MEHARELAPRGGDAGEIVAAMGGDGLAGAVAGELRDGTGLLAVLPGGRGNDFARKLGIPFDPVEACGAARRPGSRRGSTSPTPAGTRTSGILSAGLRLRRQPDRARDAAEARARSSTPTACCARSRRWRQARWNVTSTARRRAFDGYSVAVANSGVFGGGMYLAPDAQLDDGLLDVVLDRGAVRSCATCAACRGSSRARTCSDPAVQLLQAARSPSTPTGRSPAYADGDPIADLPAHRRVAAGRAAGGGAA